MGHWKERRGLDDGWWAIWVIVEGMDDDKQGATGNRMVGETIGNIEGGVEDWMQHAGE